MTSANHLSSILTIFSIFIFQVNGADLHKTHHNSVESAIEQLHQILVENFINEDGLMLDFQGEIPTPEDCRLGKPNSLGWWSPIENGPMFTGSYLAAICKKAKISKDQKDRDLASKLAKGLIKSASVSDVPGFIVRGFATDGKSHYPLGSQDQTHPWFYGLHAYATSGIPNSEERKKIIEKMVEVANVLEANDWKCPCDGIFKGQNRGEFKSFRNHGAVMYLFILRAMYDLTKDSTWLNRYRKAIIEKSPRDGMTRLQICEEGLLYDVRTKQIEPAERALQWIYVSSQGGLAWLAAIEDDPKVKKSYTEGLMANAKVAIKHISVSKQFNNQAPSVFGNANWREGYGPWFEQKTQQDAVRMSNKRIPEILGKRKTYEVRYMRHPLAAAALTAMAGYESGFPEVKEAIMHYDYSKINMAEMFFAECAYYAMMK